jgi:hypothetical protein
MFLKEASWRRKQCAPSSGQASRKTHLIANFKRLANDAQAVLLMELGNLYEQARSSRLGALKAEIAKLASPTLKKSKRPAKKTRANPQPTHRSKKDKTLTWSGSRRGGTL